MGKKNEELVRRVEFEGVGFTVVNWKGEWCYLDAEVCNYLEYSNISKTLSDHVRDNHKIKVLKKEWNEFKLNNNETLLFESSRKGFYLKGY